MIVDMFNAFNSKLRELLSECDESVLNSILSDIEKDATGYAAATIAGRTYGYARVKEISMLADNPRRVEIIDKLLRIVTELLSKETTVAGLLNLIS